MANVIRDLLASLGVIDEPSVEPYYPRVRDRDDIAVLRCRRSGVIFLDTTDHVSLAYYEKRQQNAPGRRHAQLEAALQVAVRLEGDVVVAPKLDDAQRRVEAFGSRIRDRRWLDIGTGSGRILDFLAGQCIVTVAVEPNENLRREALSRGYSVYRTIDDIPGSMQFDVVTLFHVLEHLADPVGTLQRLAAHLSDDGTVIVEVPHARDFLLETFDCDSFRRFTLWSEHLVLHTRASLVAVLKAAGFRNAEVVGYQRYPLANHLYWLRYGKPGGHEKWDFLNDPALHSSYASKLDKLDQTDTLVAYARR